MRQLTLDMPLEPRFGAHDFLVGAANEAAVATLERWPDWPDRLMLLVGAQGSGKSHLAAIWAGRAGAATLPARSVTGREVDRLADAGALVLEDLDRGPLAEPDLFHLFNLGRERGRFLLVTSGRDPASCGVRLPDLLSRLRLAPSIELGPPDDALFRAVLVKHFHDRQLLVDASVVEFVAARIERSYASAARVVAALDREALSLGRRVTRPVAALVIGRMEGGETRPSELSPLLVAET